MTWLNGWQRLGLVLSGLWALVAIGLSANDYYRAYSSYSHHIESDASIAACREKARSGPNPEQSAKACFVSETEITGRQISRPSFPPVLPILALIFLPIAAGWLIAYFAIWATRWVREGFKLK